jgi:flavin-dependent dehydrogenase
VSSAQVLVIGGGPAGSTASTLLAREGFDVVLLERDHFPRYHVGESILPSCLPILDLLGGREKIDAHGFQRKGGAYFEWGAEEWDLTFGALSGRSTYAWQVVRSQFDQLLLEHAKSQGVTVREGVAVREVLFEGDRAVGACWSAAEGRETGEITFEHLIDASGRAGVLATRHLKSRRFHEVFKNVAAWGYWTGAKKLDRGAEGAIGVFSVPGGWFWAIPLHDGTLSVGLVIEKEDFNERRREQGGLEGLYHAALKDCPRLTSVLTDARLATPLKVEQDYSYVAERFAGPGYLISGDAACFLDPLLSSGVHMATFSALLAAAAVTSILRGEVAEDRARFFYETAYRHAYERTMVLVSAFYQAYRGRDQHFFLAQKLTRAERHRLHLDQAFLHVVTGIEDLADAQDAAYDLVVDHLTAKGGGNPLAALNFAKEQMPASAENSIGGLYLVTRPRLGLKSLAAEPV